MLKKFKALSTLKKTAIILVLIGVIFVAAPLTLKYASAGEIDLFAIVQELLFRVDQQEAKITELEGRLDDLENGKPEEPADPEEPGEEPGEGSGSGPVSPEPPSDPPTSPDNDPPIPPDEGSGGPVTEPEEEEELGEEPEPWPALAKVDYMLGPQRSDSGRMVYRFEGTKLYCDFYVPKPGRPYSYITWEKREEDTEYAFTEVIDLVEAWEKWENEGIKPSLKGQLPVNVIINPKREGDTLKFDLLNWLGKDAPYEVRFPERQIYVLP